MNWTALRPEDVYDAERLSSLRGRDGYWPDRPLWDFVEEWAADSPDDIVYIDDRDAVTIGSVLRTSNRMAGGLRDLGVAPGDRILVQLPNRIEAAVAFLAAMRLGAVFVPAQVVLRRHDVASLAERTKASVIIGVDEYNDFDHAAMLSDVAAAVSTVRHVVNVGDAAAGTVPFADLSSAAFYEGPTPHPDSPAVVVFTSGTTSQPKGCVHTANTYINHARAPGTLVGASRSDVMLMPPPVMHNTGLGCGILMPLVYRMRSVLQGRWDPEVALDLIAAHGCTMTMGAPVFATMLLDAYEEGRHDVASLRVVGLGGAPVPRSTVDALHERFQCQVVAMYGSTEGGLVVATRPDDPPALTADSDGRALDGVDLVLVGSDDRVVAPGDEGEIRFASPGRFTCYWADDARTREVIDDAGRFRTGDLARMDEGGYLRITGRLSDMIIRGGMNISAAEVENLLLLHSDVNDVAIVGMPDERLGERSMAFVVTGSSSLTLEVLVEHLSGLEIAKYKYPERLELVDRLPRNASGKVEKFRLR